MRDDGFSAAFREQPALVTRPKPRELVRLIQCSECSKPFSSPVTLPCGHAVCRSCLPSPTPRANITYPNTPDRQYGIACPVQGCDTEHPTGECNVDVTLANVLDLVRLEVTNQVSQSDDSPLVLFQETVSLNESEGTVEKREATVSTSKLLHGGRLASTFTLAEMGELQCKADVAFDSSPSVEDDGDDLDIVLLDSLRDAVRKELDCLVCYNLMIDPTTTGCGHTFCRRCLARVMDHSNICPLCRRPLHIPASLQDQPSNTRLNALLDSLCPELVAARLSALASEERAGDDVLDTPLFVCTLSLPSMPTFLRIFEPRYRLMIRRCLEGNRQFGMVMVNRTSAPQGDLGVTEFLEYGTLLEIVGFELLRNGQSLVETRGISRFRIREHGMLDGYHVGRVEKVEDVSLAEEERQEAADTTAALAISTDIQRQGSQVPPEVALSLLSTRQLYDRGMEFIERIKARSASLLGERGVEIYGGPPNDPAIFPYWFACLLPIAEEEKYLFLQTTTVRVRLKMVNMWIRRIENQRWAPGSGCVML